MIYILFATSVSVVSILVSIFLHLQLITFKTELLQSDVLTKNQTCRLKMKDAIIDLSNTMLEVSSINKLLNTILKKVIEVIPEAEYGSILVMNEEELLEFHAIYGFDERLMLLKLNPEETYQWKATKGNFNSPIIIDNLIEYSVDILENTTLEAMNEIDTLTLRSSLSAPLLIDGKFYGSINIDSVSSNVFNQEHIKLMAYFVNQATIAIDNHNLYKKVLFLSKYDGLTKAYNRNYFEEIFETMLHKSQREKESVTLVLCDLNKFKEINDHYGHLTGDAVLRHFSIQFSSQMRKSDLFARFGGDEFIAVFFNSNSIQTKSKMELIYKDILSNPFLTSESNVPLYSEFSYGLAEFPKEGNNMKTLVHIADKRMYERKEK
jgi:diguanylate cyclase (GGDEF)-like protein